MPLKIYRYHRADCPVHTLNLPTKAKRFYRDCDCVIWMFGPNQPRKSTGLRDWRAAEALLLSKDAKSKDTAVYGPTLADCIQWYLDSKAHEVGTGSLDSTKRLLNRLREYVQQQHSVFHIQQLTIDLAEKFVTYGLAHLKRDTSKATSVSKLKCFLRESLRRGWIMVPLAEKIKSHPAVYDQKLPFTTDEVTKILEAAEQLNTGHVGYAKHGATFKVQLELMLLTGLRVGDSVQHDPKLTRRGEHMWIHTYYPDKQKRTTAPKQLDIYLEDGLKQAIDTCAWLSPDLPFAYLPLGGLSDTDREKRVEYLSIECWRNMRRVGKRCGIEDCRPHRLRDTFAVRLLEQGVAIEDVSRLLGHSSVRITERYYSPWVKTRQNRLERVRFESSANTLNR